MKEAKAPCPIPCPTRMASLGRMARISFKTVFREGAFLMSFSLGVKRREREST